MSKEISAGIVVYHLLEQTPKFLLLHYPGGHFDFPKGHLELNESNLQAAIRELEEETGLQNPQIDSDFQESMQYYFTQNSVNINKTVHYFLGEVIEDKIELSNEHQGFCWLPYEEAVQKISFDNSRGILKKAWEHMNTKGLI